MTEPSEAYERGMAVRREVLGDAHVDRATQNVTPFDARFQTWITETAWGGVWADPTLDRRTRSLVTIAILGALRSEELTLHLKAAREHRHDAGRDRRGADARRNLRWRPSRQQRVRRGEGPVRNRTGRRARRIWRQPIVTDDLSAGFESKVYSDHPPFSYPGYRSTIKRGRTNDMVAIVHTLSELTGPAPGSGTADASNGWSAVTERDADLTTNAGTGAEAIGSRTIVVGRVTDVHGRPVPNAMIEIWQANACGRYAHWRESAFPAPLDPNFLGAGRCVTDADGQYRFLTIRPGPYPWGNHPNVWRPAHIHLSLFGAAWASRLVTQSTSRATRCCRSIPFSTRFPSTPAIV